MKLLFAYLALPCMLVACAAPTAESVSSAHIAPLQCRDLAALRQGAEPTHQRLGSEVAVLVDAGYFPPAEADTYPGSYFRAQRRVNYWYAKDCQSVRQD